MSIEEEYRKSDDGDNGFDSARLIMRRWQRGQEHAWFAIFGDPAVTKLTFGTPYPNLQAGRGGIERIIQKSERDKPLGWWAVVEKISREIIGTVGLDALSDGRTAELGYHFRQDVWDRGYATEAAQATVAYGFVQGLCTSIIAFIHPENSASRRVLEKSSFRFVGTVEHGSRQAEKFERTQCDFSKCRG
jgi:ribosomal-protein-alanine N-acetyltransferase